ncbi:hypothetical protein HDV00_004448 [Rhizophlyctis rosea]|nr:hypothetical protein HDV00_004448 [Rhizophlyctis rosea]
MNSNDATPTTVVAQRATHTPLIELVGFGSKLVVDGVYLNGLHALRRFEIKNISPHALVVKLRSNLGEQVAFQLTNENLPDRDFATTPRKKAPTPHTITEAVLATAEEASRHGKGEDVGPWSPSQGDSSGVPSIYNTPSEAGTPPEPVEPTTSQITTNTVEAATIGVFGAESNALHGHQFNQLFNYVNHIDEVRIEPGQSQKVILAFLPDVHGRGRKTGTSESDGSRRDEAVDGGAFMPLSADEECYDFVELNGQLFFFAYKTGFKAGVVEPRQDESGSEEAGSRRNETEKVSLLAAAPGENEHTVASTNGVDGPHPPSESSGQSVSAAPDYQMTVKFRSRVCRSVLWTDIGETGIIFDDCVVGETYYKDFTVWNRSEIDLFWVLNTVDLSNRQDSSWLKFTDQDTGEALDGSPIPAYSHRRIRITFRPREVGEVNYDLQLENANDSANTVQALIHAVVRSVAREEALVVSSGNVIDFGDCCAGIWAKQRLVLRNVSEQALEISFSADDPSVVFQLKSDESFNELADHASLGFEDGDELLDRLKALNLDSTGTRSEYSRPASETSSRGSSPSRKPSTKVSKSASTAELFEDSGASSSPESDVGEDVDAGQVSDSSRAGVGRNGEEFRRIEELVLRSGTERVVEVCYLPEKEALTEDYRGGRLMRRNFKVVLEYAHPGKQHRRERKTLQCKARTCTSFINVTPKEVNFGDTDVGTLKSAPIQVQNCSEVAARVEFRFVSKVLNCFRGELVIPPKQSLEVKIDIYPRKVNPDYRKQVTIVNLLNRDNDTQVEVRSTNIDQHRVTFHSLFYRILTPQSTNFIDFGAVVVNSPTVRTFTIDNITKKTLVLELTSSMPDDIMILMKSQRAAPTDSPENTSIVLQRREKLLEHISDRRKLGRGGRGDKSVHHHGSDSPKSLTPAATSVGGGGGGAKMRVLNDFDSESTASAEYLDLASTTHGGLMMDGRLSPKRKMTKSASQTGSLKHIRSQLRDRLSLMGDEDPFSGRVGHGGGSSTGGVGTLFASASEESGTDGLMRGVTFTNGRGEEGGKDDTGGVKGEDKGTSLVDVLEGSRLPIDELISLLESATGVSPPLFGKSSSEEKYVRGQMLLRRQLDGAIRGGGLVPARVVDIPPQGEVVVVVVFTAVGDNKQFAVSGKARKQDAQIFFRLLEFDQDIQQPQFEALLREDRSSIPVRELMLRTTISRSIMDLGQKHINFGTLDRNEHRTKSILIRNNSEVALLYSIKKSGSIASGDIIIGDGKMGIVRPYQKREIEFVFDPSLAGAFHENITIENVMDAENNQVMSVKANIRKPANFSIQHQSLDFGVCLVDEGLSVTQYVVVSNTSFKTTRSFEVRVDPQELEFHNSVGKIEFDIVEGEEEYYEELVDMDGGGGSGAAGGGDNTNLPSEERTQMIVKKRRKRPVMLLSKEMEEEIEHLEQKLKIAKRKGRKDKVKKVADKLEKLRAGIVEDQYAGGDEGDEEGKKEKKKEKEKKGKDGEGEGGKEKEKVGEGEDVGKVAEGEGTEGVKSDGEKPRAPSSRGSSVEVDQGDAVTKVREATPESEKSEGAAVGTPASATAAPVGPAPLPSQNSTGAAGLHKVKRTETSIVFPLEPRAIKTVAVRIRTVRRPEGQVGGAGASSLGVLPDGVVDSPLSFLPPTTPASETCTGRIYVQEHKNADVVKKVSFRCTICYDETTYAEALREQEARVLHVGGGGGGEEGTGSVQDVESATVSPRSSSVYPPTARISPLMSPTVPVAVDAGMIGSAPPAIPPALPTPTMSPLTAELQVIPLGKVEVHQRKDVYFTLMNRGEETVPFRLVPTEGSKDCQFREMEGVLAAGETRRVDLSITPVVEGKQVHGFLVRDVSSGGAGGGQDIPISFEFYGIRSTYLRFSYGFEEQQQQIVGHDLDLGYCYVEQGRKYAKVVPVTVENVSEGDLHVSATSNLAQQCFIFCDEGLEVSATDLVIGRGGRTRVFIALQPYLTGASGAGGSGTVGRRGAGGAGGGAGGTAIESRTLIGGIKFLVQTKEEEGLVGDVKVGEGKEGEAVPPSSLFALITQTVKFTAVIGQSLMSVSDSVIDLGCTSVVNGKFSARFAVRNLTPRLPLEWAILYEGGKLDLSKKEGRLLPLQEGAGAGEEAEASTVEWVDVILNCDSFGFHAERLTVVNLNNRAQALSVEVRLFSDDGRLNLRHGRWNEAVALWSMVRGSDLTESAERRAVPHLEWDDVYVTASGDEGSVSSVVLQRRLGVVEMPLYGKVVDVENVSERSITVVPRCDLSALVQLSGPDGVEPVQEVGLVSTEGSPTDSMEFRTCGKRFVVGPHQKTTIVVTVPLPNGVTAESLEGGHKVVSRGSLILDDADTGSALKLVTLSASYCTSKGAVEPTMLDLGKIGHFNNWADVRFSFVVKNLAAIPLQYDLDLPDAVDIVPRKEEQNHPSAATKGKVEPLGQQVVEAILRPRSLDLTSAGVRNLDIGIINAFNPRNHLNVNVLAHMTLFELRFDRLASGEVVLPPLFHPHVPTALPCDSWFTIINTSDDDVKFETGVTLAPDVSEFVKLDVLSRFSNSPLSGTVTLAGKGSIEVRVRAYAREDSRLPPNHPNARYLTNADGITFGTLWVTTKAPGNLGSAEASASGGGGAEGRMVENIPVRGVLVEGNTFALSQKRLELHSLMVSDSDDEGISVGGGEGGEGSRGSPVRVGNEGEGICDTSTHQRESLTIINLSSVFPLEFRVSLEFPMEFPTGSDILRISPLSDDLSGTVEAGGHLTLDVVLLNPRIGGISEDVKIHIYDKNSLTRQPQTVYVSIVEQTMKSVIFNEAVGGTSPAEAAVLERMFSSRSRDLGPPSSQDLENSKIREIPDDYMSPGEETAEDVWFSDAMSNYSNFSSIAPVDRVLLSQSSRPSLTDLSSGSFIRRSNAHLHLRGCKRISDTKSGNSEIGGLFELDLGQQDLGTNTIIKKLTLDNGSLERVHYRIRTLSDSDRSWLVFSRSEGTLEAHRGAGGGSGAGGQRESQSITLSFMLNMRGVYSTYAFVENIENPVDTKTIRITAEVVARKNVRRTTEGRPAIGVPTGSSLNLASEPTNNHVFDVFAHAVDLGSPAIEMDYLYSDTEYSARSIIICNRESVPLEFDLKSNLSYDDESELMFSLSRTSAKIFKKLTVEPESQARVYLLLRPSNGPLWDANFSDTPPPVIKRTLAQANEPKEKNIEIYINCRLVKDYQKIIPLHALCRYPQVELSSHELSFLGSVRRKEVNGEGAHEEPWAVAFKPGVAELEVTNLLLDPLDYEVINDTMYFLLENADVPSVAGAAGGGGSERVRRNVWCIEPEKGHRLLVRPNLEAIAKHAESLRRSASGSRRSYNLLEASIVKLLRDLDGSPATLLVMPDDSDSEASHERNKLSEKSAEIYFQYTYIVDQLIHYGTREHAAENYLHLANLLFTMLFSNAVFKDMAPSAMKETSGQRCWPPALARWISTFLYFMSYFPHRLVAVEPLRGLFKSLVAGASAGSASDGEE